MRASVHHYIDDKSLGVGFASASEVCATREGDCSEHAVLLVALLRAAGIPSRAVSGVVYVDSFVGERQVFGFHVGPGAHSHRLPTEAAARAALKKLKDKGIDALPFNSDAGEKVTKAG